MASSAIHPTHWPVAGLRKPGPPLQEHPAQDGSSTAAKPSLTQRVSGGSPQVRLSAA